LLTPAVEINAAYVNLTSISETIQFCSIMRTDIYIYSYDNQKLDDSCKTFCLIFKIRDDSVFVQESIEILVLTKTKHTTILRFILRRKDM
jgi:hypothetical protein